MKINLDQRPSRREQVFFGLIVLALLSLFPRVYVPLAKKAEGARSKVQTLSMEKEALTKYLEAAKALKKGTATSRETPVKMKVLLGEIKPASDELESLLAQVIDLRFLGGVTVQNLSYRPPASEQGFTKTDFSINVLGGFSNLIQYLGRMEQFPALFYLKRVTLRAVEGQPQDLEGEIQGVFFRREPLSSLPSVVTK